MSTSGAIISTRRYDLDWLRVIVFGLLIFYHIGMFYVTWGFHVKSAHMGTTLEPLMKLLNPWRLSLLFFISGVAVKFAMDKFSLSTFALRRTRTLLIPIVFGVLVVVAPQSWLELLEKGETTAHFFDFYLTYISGSGGFSIITPTWNHLWYVVYILVYTLILVALALPVRKALGGVGDQALNTVLKGKSGVFWVLTLPIMLFALHHFVLRPQYPSTHALIGDWANHQLYFGIFLLGVLVSKNTAFWHAVDRALKPALILVVLLSITACFVWYFESLGEPSQNIVILEYFSERLRKTAFAWFAIVALLALAQRRFNKPSRVLTYMNEAIFSWYILHQTLIIVFGYWLTRTGVSFGLEITSLILFTFFSCFFIHEFLVRRSRWIRPLFGVRSPAQKPSQ